MTSRSHMGHICALQSLPKAGFYYFLRTARLCIEVWCFWIHLGIYSTIETLQLRCFLLFSWALIAAVRNEELVKGCVVWVCPLLHPVYSARTTDMIKLTHILRCFGGMYCRVQHFAECGFLNLKKWFNFQPSSLHTEFNALLCISSPRVSFLELRAPTLSCTE